ncbi:MAG: hypothetical protein QOI55_1594 [Actinomycetota bacterium]|jgi:uncharacterized HhH-GPD family protein|nr:hypothetical protein [Actinomycetota bacterium]
MTAPEALYFTPDPEANQLLAADPLALLLGMLLDQQVTMEAAFRAPLVLRERLGGRLDAASIAAMPPDDLDAVFRQRPALHRFPGSMAKRTHAVCQFLVEHYDGKAEKLWEDVASGPELLERLRALPGFGADKARIFVGVLGKRLGVQPSGWQEVAADWASIADVDSFERIEEIREKKRAAKAAKKQASTT